MMLLTFIILMTVSVVLVSAVLFFFGVGIVVAVADTLARLLKCYFPVLAPLSMLSVLLLFLIVLVPVVALCIAGLFVLRRILQ